RAAVSSQRGGVGDFEKVTPRAVGAGHVREKPEGAGGRGELVPSPSGFGVHLALELGNGSHEKRPTGCLVGTGERRRKAAELVTHAGNKVERYSAVAQRYLHPSARVFQRFHCVENPLSTVGHLEHE